MEKENTINSRIGQVAPLPCLKTKILLAPRRIETHGIKVIV